MTAPKFDVVAALKGKSRELFQNMPKAKRLGDKRRKKPRYGYKLEN